MDKDKSQFSMDFSGLDISKKLEYKGSETIPEYFEPKAPFFIRHLLWRRHLNMNSIILIVGAVRTGKSYMALKIAENYTHYIKKEFSVNDQVSFEIIPFLKWSQTETDNIFVLDEVGISLNPHEWYSIQSRVFRNFTQAQGFRRNVMILVLPNISFLLKSIRFMCNYVIETRGQGKGLIYKLMMNHIKGKGYPVGLGFIKFSLPSKKIIEPYEALKKKWNDEKLEEDINELIRSEEKKKNEFNSYGHSPKPILKLARRIDDPYETWNPILAPQPKPILKPARKRAD